MPSWEGLDQGNWGWTGSLFHMAVEELGSPGPPLMFVGSIIQII
jgi:hypothetical protein